MTYEFVKSGKIYSTDGAQLVYTTKEEPSTSSCDGVYMGNWEYTEYWCNPKTEQYFVLIYKLPDKRGPPFLWFGQSRLETPPKGEWVLEGGYARSKDVFFDILAQYSKDTAVELLKKIDKDEADLHIKQEVLK